MQGNVRKSRTSRAPLTWVANAVADVVWIRTACEIEWKRARGSNPFLLAMRERSAATHPLTTYRPRPCRSENQVIYCINPLDAKHAQKTEGPFLAERCLGSDNLVNGPSN